MNAENALQNEHGASPLNSGTHDGGTTERSTRPDAKWAAVVADRLIPLPRRRLRARDIQVQAGVEGGTLIRDLNQPQDVPIHADVEVDLGEGNVFRVIPKCESSKVDLCPKGQAKLAFVMDDAWEITIQPKQTLDSLRGLFDLPDDAEILRDYESPHDEPIQPESTVRFTDGPVFRSRVENITIKVNNQPVRLPRRRVTGLEIKQAAIAQGVSIDLQFVLYRITKGGDLSAAIRDDQYVLLGKCEQFRCIAADDNS